MSDELDFFDDPTPAVSTDPEPAPVETPPAPSGPSAEEIAAMQKRLENAEKWQQDFARLAGQMGGQQPQAQQPDYFTKLVQDPNGFVSEIVGSATQAARAQLQEMQAIEKVRSEFPELAPFEEMVDWGALMQKAGPQFMQKHGRQPSFEEALRESASLFKSSLQGTGVNPQAGQREVLRLNAGGSPPPAAQGLEGLDLNKLSKEEFYKLKAELEAKNYQ